MTVRACVLVLGMHRSGTSALTRVLSLLGCEVPENLLEANAGNMRGYWESRPIMELNNRILKSGGSEWFDCQRFNPNWFKSVIVKKFKDEAKAVLKSEFGSADLFVLKDPRVSVLLPFWLAILKELRITPVPIVTMRHPLEVAASLERQHQFQLPHILLLWLRYMLEAERETRGMRRMFTSYDQLLNDPRDFIARSQQILDLAWPGHSPRVVAEIEEFLSADLRNHVQPSVRQMRLPVAQDWIRSTYAILDRWTQDEAAEGDIQELTTIYEGFEAGLEHFGRLVDDNSRMSLLARKLSDEINALKQGLEESKSADSAKIIIDLEQQVKRLEYQRTELERKNSALAKGVVKLQQEIAGKDSLPA